MTLYEKQVKVKREKIIHMDPKNTSSFEQPAILGSFNIDKERCYVPGAENMQYFYSRYDELKNADFKLDLNEGIDNVVRKSKELNEKLNHLLEFIAKNYSKLLNLNSEISSQKMLDADFICYRGLLTQIMCSLYLREEWSIAAIKYKGTIYLCLVDKKEFMYCSQKEQDKFCSWGYKFEQYMLTDKPGVPPDTSKPVVEPEEFCCMFNSKLGPHKLIYGAEMDGIVSKEPINKDAPDWAQINFVELKTSKQVPDIATNRILKKKFLKWWAQSFLVNVQEIHCGFRDNRGIIRDIVRFKTKDLPKLSSNEWNWRTCLNFCNIFFDIIKDTIPEETNNPYKSWKFIWNPDNDYFKIEEFKTKSEYSFLPEWYIKL